MTFPQRKRFQGNLLINVLLLLLLLLLAGVRSGRGWPTPVLCDPSTHVACRNRPDICIPFERLQDGQADCPDASDEGQLLFFFSLLFFYTRRNGRITTRSSSRQFKTASVALCRRYVKVVNLIIFLKKKKKTIIFIILFGPLRFVHVHDFYFS